MYTNTLEKKIIKFPRVLIANRFPEIINTT